ncbi:peptide chain release factor 1-like, mitochondrial [Belonocnema kinseyi]|uniref:peptide chain release factor 1-like, mitochondrial n=1 Tax=Belonocnema kinseyi TaxID=2817044 RepID=UPI00143DE973|nr:peptide chain release factor 1-like, mitochondrial [Belonocnema kinseyi]
MKILTRICLNYCSFLNSFGRNRVFRTRLKLTGEHNLKYLQTNLFGYRSFTSEATDFPEKSVKKLLEHATKVYEGREKDRCEIMEVLENQEVEVLMQERLKIVENIRTLEELIKIDKDMKLLAEEEFTSYSTSLRDLDIRLLNAISSNLGREYCENIILEISAGVGGQEAMLFANDLLEMYSSHLIYLGYTFTLMEKDMTAQGGIRHASLTISGRGSYEKLRHEAGVHRVQRVPATESSGRIHTSVVSVVILPQPSEIEVSLEDKDIRIETKKSSGAGGQHVNTTDSAVRILHIPTGIAVECQTERSQIKNKALAFIKLRTRIYEKKMNEQTSTTKRMRRSQMGFKSRNERIRTYNFLQDRVTDHRLPDGTMHELNRFMQGGPRLDEMHEKLQETFQRKVLIETLEDVEKGQ